MAGSVNRITIIGNLGKDPEVKSLNSGSRVVNFSVATSEIWTDKAGARQERTEWWNIVVWDEKLGEVAEKYLRKGSKVYLVGSGQSRTYTSNGEERSVFEVVLRPFRSELTLLDPAPSKGEQVEIRRNPNPASRPKAATSRGVPDDDYDFVQ